MLIDRLNTDLSLRPLVVQFVPLKVETAGEPWQKWARKYPPQGNAIPIIYVIRADGKMLYGRSGPVPGDDLSRFMAAHLNQAGRVFNDQEAAVLTKAVETAKKAVEGGDTFKAVKALSTTVKLGPLGNLGSFAKVAKQADQLVKQLVEQGKARLEEARESLSKDSASFEDALSLMQVKREYSRLPALKTEISAALRQLGKDAALRDTLKQAEALERALAYLSLPGYKSRGISSLRKVAERYPDTPAGKLAQEQLAELDVPAATVTQRTAPKTGSGSAGTSAATARKKASSYLRMARVFAKNRPEKALTYAQKVIDLLPESEEARQAQELIDGLK